MRSGLAVDQCFARTIHPQSGQANVSCGNGGRGGWIALRPYQPRCILRTQLGFVIGLISLVQQGDAIPKERMRRNTHDEAIGGRYLGRPRMYTDSGGTLRTFCRSSKLVQSFSFHVDTTPYIH